MQSPAWQRDCHVYTIASMRVLRVYAGRFASSYTLLLMRRASGTSVQKMAGILERLRTLPPVEQRRAACMLGAVVADTASEEVAV